MFPAKQKQTVFFVPKSSIKFLYLQSLPVLSG